MRVRRWLRWYSMDSDRLAGEVELQDSDMSIVREVAGWTPEDLLRGCCPVPADRLPSLMGYWPIPADTSRLEFFFEADAVP